jgi:acid phosphatase
MRSFIAFAASLVFVSLSFGCKNTAKQEQASVLPKPDHVIVVIEENHGFDQIIGAPQAPYINQLASEGALFTNSHGVTHPSQPNYIALFSGSLQGVKGDECLADTAFTSPNLGGALLKAGYTFKGYGETMPSEGFKGCYYQKSTLTHASLYGRKHCPWVNWLGDGPNQMADSLSKPMTEFPSDFGQLPTVAFVIPNMDNDMHNNGGDTVMVRRADDWLRQNLSGYVSWAKDHNSLLILTFDEDNFTKHNQIPTIFVGAHVKPGKYADSINHYNVLRTLEQMYQLQPSGPAKAAPITQVWDK